jgi:2-iminobutanoate/2-iminopropanoate deaminase
MVKAIRSASLPAPKFRYSPLVSAGPFVKSAGLVGLDAETGELVSGGVGAQAKCILGNIAGAMAECGLILDDLVAANVYVTDFGQFPDFNTEWELFLKDADVPPARTSVGVQSLPIGALIEIDFLFYAPDLSARTGNRDET